MKRVELVFEINPDGTILVSPKGTQGSECLSLMEFLDKIDGLTVVKTEKTEDFNISQPVIEKVKDLT